jgi:DNA-binding MarR family transcriptional regulator
MPRQKKDEYRPIVPLDFLILAELPDEGSLFMGVYPEGKTAKDVTNVVGKGVLKISTVSTRLRMMRKEGLTERTHGLGFGTLIWQITPKGKALLRQWESTQTKEKENGNAAPSKGKAR